jgi:hypothetical protein
MTFPGNLSLPMIVLGAFEERHTFKIERYTDYIIFDYKPAGGENQPKTGGGI